MQNPSEPDREFSNELELLHKQNGTALFYAVAGSPDDPRNTQIRNIRRLIELTLPFIAKESDTEPRTLGLVSETAEFINLAKIDSIVIRVSLVWRDGPNSSWRFQIFRGSSESDCASDTLVCEVSQRFRIETSLRTSDKTVSRKPTPPKVVHVTTQDGRRDLLLKAAGDLFSEMGFGSVSVRDIAVAAALTPTIMYQYVSSKEELLYLIIKEHMTKLHDALVKPEYNDDDAYVNLDRAIEAYLEFSEGHRRVVTLLYRETRSLSLERRREILDTERKIINIWANIIEDGQSRGQFSVQNPFLAANAVYSLCTMRALRWWAVGRFDRASVAEVVKRFSQHGIAKSIRP